MGIQILSSPPRVVIDYSDLQPLATEFLPSYLGDRVSDSAPGTYGQQITHTARVNYRIDNEGEVGVVSGFQNIVDATTQGGFTHPGFVDSQTQNNFVGLIPQPAHSNLFDPPTIATTDATSSITLSGASHGFLSPHSFSFTETKLATATALVREANLQSLIDAYPNGTITIVLQNHSSQNYRYDIHGDFAITAILSTSGFVNPSVTFPLSDFGLEPSTPPDPNPEECLCEWTDAGLAPDTVWTRQTNTCPTFTLDPLPVTTWTKRGCP